MDEADDQLREALVFHGVQVECKFMLIIVKPVPGGTHRGLDEGVLQEASCQTPEWSCRTTGGEEQLHSIECGNIVAPQVYKSTDEESSEEDQPAAVVRVSSVFNYS